MSGYLARLKEVEKRKNFHNSPESELTKPPKGASVSFVSSVPEENKKILMFNRCKLNKSDSGFLRLANQKRIII